MLDAAASLQDLRQPPGSRLEALKGDRAGQHSDPDQRTMAHLLRMEGGRC
jgi:hypothetical protein